MYYVVYGLLYVFSLLPLSILYLFSELGYAILYHLVKYRRAVVMNNLEIAFPEKTHAERVRICKQFCRNLTDTFTETLKMISISEKELHKRAKTDASLIHSLIDKGYNISIMAGHQFNWEMGNQRYSKEFSIPMIGVYTRVNNKIFDRIFLKLRSRMGTVMVSKEDFRVKKEELFSGRYLLALAADQNPHDPSNAYWLNFFGKMAPFITGPARGAIKQETAIVFVGFRKLSRGRYELFPELLAERAQEYSPEQLTQMYRDRLEETIRRDPANYLWSHRRWRHSWKPEYGPPVE